MDAPFAVGRARNRRAERGDAVARADRADALQCLVHTSLVTEDPDYAIFRYRYGWRVGGKFVRAVTNAGLSVVLRHRLARAGRRAGCTVTPSDGKLLGPPAAARVRVR